MMWMLLYIVSYSHQYVLASVVQKCDVISFNLVCSYGDPHHKRTQSISFICMGDLNNIMPPNEKWGPGPPCLTRINNFCALVKQCGFMDLGYSGPAYTWTNRRFTTNPTYERLDAWEILIGANVFLNLWFIICRCYIVIMPLSLLFCRALASGPKPKRNFRFQNWWLNEDDFHEVANQAWLRSTGKPFHIRTNALTGSIKRWVRKKKTFNSATK